MSLVGREVAKGAQILVLVLNLLVYATDEVLL